MACAQAAAVLSMEVFVEQQVIAPVGIVLEGIPVSVNWTPTLSVAQKDSGQASRQLLADLPQGQVLAGASRAFHFEVAAVVVMELLQRLDDEKVDRKPNRPTPVRIAAKQA